MLLEKKKRGNAWSWDTKWHKMKCVLLNPLCHKFWRAILRWKYYIWDEAQRISEAQKSTWTDKFRPSVASTPLSQLVLMAIWGWGGVLITSQRKRKMAEFSLSMNWLSMWMKPEIGQQYTSLLNSFEAEELPNGQSFRWYTWSSSLYDKEKWPELRA